MKSLFLLPLAALIVLLPSAHAGGSISRADALSQVCARNRALCEVLGQLRLQPAGSAVRDREGNRLMPFEFSGLSRGGRPIQVVISSDEQGIVLSIR